MELAKEEWDGTGILEGFGHLGAVKIGRLVLWMDTDRRRYAAHTIDDEMVLEAEDRAVPVMLLVGLGSRRKGQGMHGVQEFFENEMTATWKEQKTWKMKM